MSISVYRLYPPFCLLLQHPYLFFLFMHLVCPNTDNDVYFKIYFLTNNFYVLRFLSTMTIITL